MPIRLFAAMAISAALSPLNSTMIAIALPEIGVAVDASAASLTLWLVTMYLVAALASQSPAGKFSDLWGRGRAMNIGRALFVAAAIIGALAPSLGWLAVARVAMGAAGALLIPTAFAVLRNAFPPERRARVFAVSTSVMAGAAAAGPGLGGVLTEFFGWHSVFLVNLPLVALAWALQLGVRLDGGERGSAAPPRRGFDWAGSISIGVSLGAGVVALAVSGDDAVLGWILGVLAVACFAAFIVWELRCAEPVIDLRMFARKRYASAASVLTLQTFSLYAVLYQLPFLLTAAAAGAGLSSMGLAMVALPGTSVVFSPAGGFLAERIGIRLTVVVGQAMATAGALWLAIGGDFASPADVAMRVSLIGAGIGLALGPAHAGALGAVRANEAGMAAGALSTLRYFGGAAGVSVLGISLAALGPASDAEAYRHVLTLFAGPFALGGVLALALPRKGEHGLH